MNEELEKYKNALALKLEHAAKEMLRSIKDDELDAKEKTEWYGYIRGVRDAAYDAGVLSRTQIQQVLEEALSAIS